MQIQITLFRLPIHLELNKYGEKSVKYIISKIKLPFQKSKLEQRNAISIPCVSLNMSNSNQGIFGSGDFLRHYIKDYISYRRLNSCGSTKMQS